MSWQTCEVSHLLLQFRQPTPVFQSAFSNWKISPRNCPVSRCARSCRFASRITHSRQCRTHTPGIRVNKSSRHNSAPRRSTYRDDSALDFAATRRFLARNAIPKPGQKTIPDHMRIPRQRYSLATVSVTATVLTFDAVIQPVRSRFWVPSDFCRPDPSFLDGMELPWTMDVFVARYLMWCAPKGEVDEQT